MQRSTFFLSVFLLSTSLACYTETKQPKKIITRKPRDFSLTVVQSLENIENLIALEGEDFLKELALESEKIAKLIELIRDNHIRPGKPSTKEFREKFENLSPDVLKSFVSHVTKQAHVLAPDKNPKTPYGFKSKKFLTEVTKILRDREKIPAADEIMRLPRPALPMPAPIRPSEEEGEEALPDPSTLSTEKLLQQMATCLEDSLSKEEKDPYYRALRKYLAQKEPLLLHWWDTVVANAVREKDTSDYFEKINSIIPFTISFYQELKKSPQNYKVLIDTIDVYNKWLLRPTARLSSRLTMLQNDLSSKGRHMYEEIQSQVSQFGISEIPRIKETGNLLLENLIEVGTMLQERK